MKERSIPFNDEMIRVILDGRKTQTRRVIKPQPVEVKIEREDGWLECHYEWKGIPLGGKIEWFMEQCPYGKPGDLLWVRETQIILKIKDVRVERIQEIGIRMKQTGCWDEIFAEGISQFQEWDGKGGFPTPLAFFIKLWDSIYAKRGFAWITNPWVWVIEFEIERART